MSYSDAEIVAAWMDEGSQRAAARKLGISRDLIRPALERAGKDPSRPPDVQLDASRERVIESELSPNARSLDDLLRETEVDLEEWEVRDSLVNSYQVAGKNADGEMEVETLYQVKAWLRRRTDKIEADRVKQEALAFIAERAAKRKAPAISRKRGGEFLFELSFGEVHLGKLAWGEETGEEDYDLKIAEEVALDAAEDLIEKAAGFPKALALVVVGNDAMQADSATGTTTKGTFVDTDSRWAKVFRRTWQTQARIIDRIRQECPVKVVVVPGNHDRNSAFAVGEVLTALYDSDDRVEVDNSPAFRKYHRHGQVLLGFTHGDSEKLNDLPLIMAQERRQEWGETTYREFHLGHLHRKRETRYVAGDSFNGVYVRHLPSLSAADAWHAQMGYVRADRASEGFIFCPQSGLVASIRAGVRRGSEAA